jgi:hypothetical protein
MNLADLLTHVTDKQKFQQVSDYLDFCARYLDYVETGLQARIVSQNERQYEFFQYREEGGFNITRPLNSDLMYNTTTFAGAAAEFNQVLRHLKKRERPADSLRQSLLRTIYTAQQAIGAALDALPAGKSNQARKLNGDLFERFIRLLIVSLNLDCVSGVVQVPVKDTQGVRLFDASYQHDLLIRQNSELKVIGSVKTSSKDRLDKVFMDKFLYSRLTNTALPHVAIFLNDVQRKKTQRENEYGVSATFLPGHFKAYTIKLNPLDGVYYCDIRPNMQQDALLAQHIKTIDHFFYSDLWTLLDQPEQAEAHVTVEPETDSNE